MSASESDFKNSVAETNIQQHDAQSVAEAAPAPTQSLPQAIPSAAKSSLVEDAPGKKTLSQLLEAACFTENDRAFLLLASGTAVLILAVRFAWIEWNQPEPLQWQQNAGQLIFRVDINSSEWSDWMQLDGIGHELATRIVENRNTNGPFLSIDDVGRVQGIGPTTLDRIRERLTIGSADSKE